MRKHIEGMRGEPPRAVLDRMEVDYLAKELGKFENIDDRAEKEILSRLKEGAAEVAITLVYRRPRPI
jgi:hypothetical protein